MNKRTRTLAAPAAVDSIDKPEEGKVYALTGGTGSRCSANGNTWKESEVKDDGPAAEAAGE